MKLKCCACVWPVASLHLKAKVQEVPDRLATAAPRVRLPSLPAVTLSLSGGPNSTCNVWGMQTAAPAAKIADLSRGGRGGGNRGGEQQCTTASQPSSCMHSELAPAGPGNDAGRCLRHSQTAGGVRGFGSAALRTMSSTASLIIFAVRPSSAAQCQQNTGHYTRASRKLTHPQQRAETP